MLELGLRGRVSLEIRLGQERLKARKSMLQRLIVRFFFKPYLDGYTFTGPQMRCSLTALTATQSWVRVARVKVWSRAARFHTFSFCSLLHGVICPSIP